MKYLFLTITLLISPIASADGEWIKLDKQKARSVKRAMWDAYQQENRERCKIISEYRSGTTETTYESIAPAYLRGALNVEIRSDSAQPVLHIYGVKEYTDIVVEGRRHSGPISKHMDALVTTNEDFTNVFSLEMEILYSIKWKETSNQGNIIEPDYVTQEKTEVLVRRRITCDMAWNKANP